MNPLGQTALALLLLMGASLGFFFGAIPGLALGIFIGALLSFIWVCGAILTN